MEEEQIPEYFLHSRYGKAGETESFHFRLKATPDSVLESFTVTYAWDGCCIMHGDYGPLMWRQNYYNGPNYGFPDQETNIGYFAEKCFIGNRDQEIEEWDWEKALSEIKEFLGEQAEDDPDEMDPEKVREFIEEDGHYWDDIPQEVGKYRMYEELEDKFPDEAWYDFDFGMKYERHFVHNFKCLQAVSGLVFEALKNSKGD